ncbi:MAG: ferritin family protein [Pseudothermotoga sp.]
MVSLSDLLSIAVQIEANGYDFYNSLANNQASQKLKEFFTHLAEQERVHQQIFRNLITHTKSSPSLSTWIDEEVSGYLKSLADVSIFPAIERSKKQLTVREAFSLAIDVEKDSIIFYSELLPYAGEERKSIEAIISEEKKHLLDLMNQSRSI